MTRSPNPPVPDPPLDPYVDALARRLMTALARVLDGELVGVQTFARALSSSPEVVAVFEVLAALAAHEHARRVDLLRTVERDVANDRTIGWWGDPDQVPMPDPEDERQRPDDT